MSNKYTIFTTFLLIVTIATTSIKPSALDMPTTPLMQALTENNLEKVKSTLSKEININAQDSRGRTALFIAVELGRPDILKELLKYKGIDVNLADKQDFTPLAVAVKKNDINAVNLLLDACEKFDHCKNIDKKDAQMQLTPLGRAARAGQEQIVKLLLKAGADPAAKVMKEGKNVAIPESFKTDDKEITELLKPKIKERPEPKQQPELDNINNRTFAFQKALIENKHDEAKKLMAQGVDVNAPTKKHIQTPLHLAAKNGYTDIVEQLIKNKANVNAKSKSDDTPLHLAAEKGHEDIVQLLIKAGANINASNHMLETPLHLAAANGHSNIVKLLIENKAFVNPEDESNDTPFDLAYYNKHRDIMVLLANAGGESYWVKPWSWSL